MAGQIAASFRRGGYRLLNWLIPPTCPMCGAGVQVPETVHEAAHSLLCAPCFNAMAFIVPPVCQRCGLPLDAEEGVPPDGVCHACRERPPGFRRARAALAYDGVSRRFILPFKHGDQTAHAPVLARWMAQAGGDLLRDADWLVPVPLHRARLRQRRYNQAALLCHALTRQTGVPGLLDALQRTRRTPSLGDLPASTRRRVLAGAIQVRPGRAGLLAGRRIVLVDDVLTSGATANACAWALRSAGAASVDVLAAARVAPRG